MEVNANVKELGKPESSIPSSSLFRALTITSLFFLAIWIYLAIYP